MKLAIVSDIHDHIWNLRRFLDWLDTHPADALLCCGDLCSPFVPALIQKAYTGPIHLVFGNNDGDTFRITRLTADHVRLHGELAEIEFNGYRVALNHYPDIAEQLARSRRYDLVCYGHNHEIRLRARGQTLLLNPGTLMGYLPEKATDTAPTFVVLDTETETAQAYVLDNDNERIDTYPLLPGS